jgi:hypothetical protein
MPYPEVLKSPRGVEVVVHSPSEANDLRAEGYVEVDQTKSSPRKKKTESTSDE